MNRLADPIEKGGRVKLLVRARAVPLTKSGDPRSPPERTRAFTAPPSSPLRLTFDTETETELPQRLRFGTAVLENGTSVLRRVVFTGEVLTPADREVIREVAEREGWEVLTCERFVQRLLVPTLEAGGCVQGLNLPFDLGALAVDWSPKERLGRKRGFTLYLTGTVKQPGPRVRVESLGGGKFLFSARRLRTRTPGTFLDVRQLHRAMFGADSLASLDALSRFYAVPHPKLSAEGEHGKSLTPDYVLYAMRDAVATSEVARAARERWTRFGLDLPAEKVYSGASIAKAALRARGIEEPPKLPEEEEGRIMSTYYAGRAEAITPGLTERIAVLDFTSQYPTLWALQRLGEVLEAESVGVVTGGAVTEGVRSFIEKVTLDDLLRRETWTRPELRAIVLVRPRGEILPARWKMYGTTRVYWARVTSETPLFYTVADVIAAKLLTGRVPEVIEARQYVAGPRRKSVRSCSILGREVPADRDLMAHLTEQRVLEKQKPKAERDPLFTEGVKPIINSGTYGITVEERVEEAPFGALVYPGAGEPFIDVGGLASETGGFYCPLVATLITSGSHLLLAMMERVAEREGAHVHYVDTDSGFIGPPERASAIAAAFQPLNPFSVEAPVLKEETSDKAPDGEWPGGTRPEGAYPSLYAIAAKRYCLFVRDPRGWPVPFHSGQRESGLGPYRTPEMFEGRRSELVRTVWSRVLLWKLDGDDYEEGDLPGETPVLREITLSTPALLPVFRRGNARAPLRPFAFAFFNVPKGKRPGRFTGQNDAQEEESRPAKQGLKTWRDVIESYPVHRDMKRNAYTGDRWEVVADGEPLQVDKETHLTGDLEDENLRLLLEAHGLSLLPTYERTPDLASLSAEERMRLKIPRSTLKKWKARLREGKPLPKGHGANPKLAKLAAARLALEKLRSPGGKLAPDLPIDPDGGSTEGRAPLEIMEGVSPDTYLAPLEGGHGEEPLDLLPSEDPVSAPLLDGEAQPRLSAPLTHPPGKLGDEKPGEQAGTDPPATSEPHPEKERLVELVHERASESRREPIPLLYVEAP